jgi:hypothetical protein
MEDDVAAVRLPRVHGVAHVGSSAPSLVTRELRPEQVAALRAGRAAPARTAAAAGASAGSAVPESWEDAASETAGGGAGSGTPATTGAASVEPSSAAAAIGETHTLVVQERRAEAAAATAAPQPFDFESPAPPAPPPPAEAAEEDDEHYDDEGSGENASAAAAARRRRLDSRRGYHDDALYAVARAAGAAITRDDLRSLYRQAASILGQFEDLAAKLSVTRVAADGPLGDGLAALLADAGIAPSAPPPRADAAAGTLRRRGGAATADPAAAAAATSGDLSITESVERMRQQLEAVRPQGVGGYGDDDDDDDGDAADGGDGAHALTSHDGGAASQPLLLLNVTAFAASMGDGAAQQLDAATAGGLMRQVWSVLTGTEPYQPPPPAAAGGDDNGDGANGGWATAGHGRRGATGTGERGLGGVAFNPFAPSAHADGRRDAGGGDLTPLEWAGTGDAADSDDSPAAHVHTGQAVLLMPPAAVAAQRRSSASSSSGVGAAVATDARRVLLAAPAPPSPAKQRRGNGGSGSALYIPPWASKDGPVPHTAGAASTGAPLPLDVPLGHWAGMTDQLLGAPGGGGIAWHTCSDTAAEDAAAVVAAAATAAAAPVLALLPYPTTLSGIPTGTLWARVTGASWAPPPASDDAGGDEDADTDGSGASPAAAAVEAFRQAVEAAHRDVRYKAASLGVLTDLAHVHWQQQRQRRRRAAHNSPAPPPSTADGSAHAALLAQLAGAAGDGDNGGVGAAHAPDPRLLSIALGTADEATAVLAATLAASPVLRLLVPLVDRQFPQVPATTGSSSGTTSGGDVGADDDGAAGSAAAAAARARLTGVAAHALHCAAVDASAQAAAAADAAASGAGAGIDPAGAGFGSGAAPAVAEWCTAAAPAVADLLALWAAGFGGVY